MTSTIEFEIDDDGTTMLPSLKHYIKALAKAYRTGHYFTGRKGKLIGDLNNQYDAFLASDNILETFELYHKSPGRLSKIITAEANQIRIGFGWSQTFNETLILRTKRGDDVINLESSGARQTLVNAGPGNDFVHIDINGSPFGDVIITGGKGADSFHYSTATLPKSLTTIEDFRANQDSFILDLTRKAKNTLSWHTTPEGMLLSTSINDTRGLLIKGLEGMDALTSL